MGIKEHSKAMDISAQLENLKNNNLIIEDEEEATRILQRISYYRLIKAYGPYFKVKKTGRYRDRTTFNQIYRVYEFDNELRHLLIPYLQEIEITIRCQITNYFCVKYGPLGYLDESNFEEYSTYNQLTEKIEQCLFQSKDSPIIRNFREKYIDGKVPLYAAIEVFTFGTLALFYKSMKKEDRKAIAAMYENVDEYYLSSWLVSIAYVRNLCSHFNRLYSKNLIKSPKLYESDKNGEQYARLYSVLCCMKYLLKESGEWPGFVGALADLLNEYTDCVKPSRIGCVETKWKEKLLDQEPRSFIRNLYENESIR